MQWFYLILLTLWLFSALIFPLVAFCLTRNLLSLSLFTTVAPPAYLLRWIAKHLFPLDEKSFLLEKARIEMKTYKSPIFKQSDKIN
jgi:hypothetical protein